MKKLKYPKSVYYYWLKHFEETQQEKDESLKQQILKLVAFHKGNYGYRRMTQALKAEGVQINHKKTLKLMKELEVLCTKFSHKSRKFKTYKGKVGTIAPHRLKRRFTSQYPLQKLAAVRYL